MDQRAGRRTLVDKRRTEYRRSKSYTQVNGRKGIASRYFSLETFLVLLCLTAMLLTLPLILPPLPPPPFLFLLVPVVILFVLFFLAFKPSDVQNMASSYL